MIKKNEHLYNEIMSFIKLTYKCFQQTNYTEDRKAYESDIILCVSWIIKLYDNIDSEKIIQEILDSSTSKFIYDYFKQGSLGEGQVAAFKNLQNKVKTLSDSTAD